jgi:hypothetical protein
MPPSSRKQSLEKEFVEAMKTVLAHHRGEIELERVVPKRRPSRATPRQSNPRVK